MLHLPFPWTGCAEGRALSQGTDGVTVCYTYHFHGQDALRAVLCHQGTDGVAVCYTYHFHGQDALRAVLCHQGTDGVDVALPHRVKHAALKPVVIARRLNQSHDNYNHPLGILLHGGMEVGFSAKSTMSVISERNMAQFITTQ